MRIAVTIERYELGRGGAEKSTEQIIQQLQARGHQPTLLCGAVGKDSSIPDVPIEAANADRFKTAGHLWRYRSWLKHRLAGPDFDTSLSVTTLAPARVVEPRAGIYYELHRQALRWQPGTTSRFARRLGHLLSSKQRAMRDAEQQTLADASVYRWVAISRYMQRQLIDRGVPPERINLIPNAAEAPVLDANLRDERRQQTRQAWQLDNHQIAFVFPAHAPRRKGAVQLLHAFAQAKAPEAVLVMVCPRDASLQRLAKQLGIDARTRWPGSTSDMASVYAAADVTILPSFYDPASKIVAESLLAAVPVITTRTNGAADLVEPDAIQGLQTPGWRGRLIDHAEDIPALSQTIRDLCDPATRQACVDAAPAIQHACSMKHHVDQLEQLLIAAAG
ncbi:glycosyltransferase family 4 protein [Mucisphaera sp.]|uniref:glycosyltransferase family 4 protein n=1 Tax=Mucisphaera sp. TaxID=2913024 RepID=UPI003D0DC14F